MSKTIISSLIIVSLASLGINKAVDMYAPLEKDDRVYILLDFDGVLADSWKLSIDLLNSYSQDYGFAPISFEEARSLTSKQLLKRYDLGLISQFFLVEKIKDGLSKKISEIPLFKGLADICEEFYRSNVVDFAIVTSNSEQNVRDFLENHGLSFVSVIHSNSSLFGKGAAISNFLKRNGVKKNNALYIGDEVRDIEGAKRAEIKSLAVTWGFDTEDNLILANPDYLASTPDKVGEVIDSFISLPRD